MKTSMKVLLTYMFMAILALLVASCNAAPLGEREPAYVAALEAGNTVLADSIQGEANHEQATSLFELALSLVPGIPPAAQGILATLGGSAALGLFSKRRREHYGKAIAFGAKAVSHLAPIPGLFSPSGVVEGVSQALLSAGASMGYAHTNQTPEALEAVASKMRSEAV